MFSERKDRNLTKLSKFFSQRQKGSGKSCNSLLQTRILLKGTAVPQCARCESPHKVLTIHSKYCPILVFGVKRIQLYGSLFIVMNVTGIVSS